MRRNHYDLCIVTSGSSFSTTNALIARLCKPALLIGFLSPDKELIASNYFTNAFYSYCIPRPVTAVGETDYYLGVLAPLACQLGEKGEFMDFSSEETLFAASWFEKNVPPRPLLRIGIHGGGTFSSRQWAPAHFGELIERFLSSKKCVVILFSGPGEVAIVKNLIAHTSETTDSATMVITIPDCSFRELAALQCHLDLFIGNDTGTLHAAAASGRPTIGIYLATDPLVYAPRNINMLPLNKPAVEDVCAAAEKMLSIQLK